MREWIDTGVKITCFVGKGADQGTIIDGLAEREAQIRSLKHRLEIARYDHASFQQIVREYFDECEPWKAFVERWERYRKEYPRDR